MSPNYGASAPEPMLCDERVAPAPHDWRKPVCSIEDPEQPKINKNFKKQNESLPYSGGRRPREKGEKKEVESPVLRFSMF